MEARHTFNENRLRGGTCSADSINCSLVELSYKGVVHIMVFIVGVKDDVRIARKLRSHGFPKGFKSRRIRDDIAIVSSCTKSQCCGVGRAKNP